MKDNITIYSPGNIVTVEIDANMNIVDIEIKDDVFSIEQKPLLEEMISSTVNQAYESMAKKLDSTHTKQVSPTHHSHAHNDNINTKMPNMPNFAEIKNMLGDENMKEIIGSINSNLKIEYKDGKPYVSMPMDMITNPAFADIIETMTKK